LWCKAVSAPLPEDRIVGLLQGALAQELFAVYLFGSHVRGEAGPDSDVDLAVLVAGKVDPVRLWELGQTLAVELDCDVDLIDLRAASTVMQYQIVMTGRRLWKKDAQAALYECAILSDSIPRGLACWPIFEVKEACMAGPCNDDVVLNKVATIERCVARAREEYQKDPATFGTDYTRQDAAILNIQRACEAALDIGQHLIRLERLGVPQSSRDVFRLLAAGGWIDTALADVLQRMVGFRNIAVHDYQTLQLPITVAVIRDHLDDFLAFARAVLHRP